jgi:hypothetical protein
MRSAVVRALGRENPMPWLAAESDSLLKIEATDTDAIRCEMANRFPGLEAIPRHRFVMTAELVELVTRDRKLTTIRYDKSGVEYPARSVLPLYAVSSHRDHDGAVMVGEVRILEVGYKLVRQLTDDDARADGFSDLGELLSTLCRYYGPMREENLVSIYVFKFIGEPDFQCQTSNPRSITDLSAA